MDATLSFRLPAGAPDDGLPAQPEPMRVRGATFDWGSRTYVMGIVNVTPDSFSGDGLLRGATGATGSRDAVAAAVEQARAMSAEGADILDVGGESSRPGHTEVSEAEERRRVIPVIAAIREALPEMPISVDSIKPSVIEAALDAGADMINDVWAVGASDAIARVAAGRRVPYVLMHNREQARYRNVVSEVVAELQRAVDRAVSVGCDSESLIVDPGIGFGKTAEQNLAVLGELAVLAVIGRPILLGVSRKSTIGKVLDLPANQRLEGTLALTALGVAAGVDVVRVHDVAPNVRAARMADAVIRGGWHEPQPDASA